MFSVQKSASIQSARTHAPAGETKKNQAQTMLDTAADALRNMFSPALDDDGIKIHQCAVDFFHRCLAPKPIMEMHHDKYGNIVITLTYTLRSPDHRDKSEMQIEATFEKGDHATYQLTLRDLQNPLNTSHLPMQIEGPDEMNDSARYVCRTLSIECVHPESTPDDRGVIATSSASVISSPVAGPQQWDVVTGADSPDGLSTAMLLGDELAVKRHLQWLVDDNELNQSQRYDRLQAKNSTGGSCLMQAMVHGHHSAIDTYFKGLAKLLAAGKISGEQAIALIEDKKKKDDVLARAIGEDNIAIVTTFIKGVATLCLDKYVTTLQIQQLRESMFNNLMYRLLDSKAESIIHCLIREVNNFHGDISDESRCWINNISLLCIYASYFGFKGKRNNIELYKSALEEHSKQITIKYMDADAYLDNMSKLIRLAGEKMPPDILNVTMQAWIPLVKNGTINKRDFLKILKMTSISQEMQTAHQADSSSAASHITLPERFHLFKCKNKENIKTYFKMLTTLMDNKIIDKDELYNLLLNNDSAGVSQGQPLLSSNLGCLSVGYGRFINGLTQLYGRKYLDKVQLVTLLESQNPETLTSGIYDALSEGDHVYITKIFKYLSKMPLREKVLSNTQIHSIVYGQDASNLLALDFTLNMCRSKDERLAPAVRAYISGLSTLASLGIINKDELINQLLPLNKKVSYSINPETRNAFLIELTQLLTSTLPELTYLYTLKNLFHQCIPLALSSSSLSTATQDINYVLQTLYSFLKKGLISEVEFTNFYMLEDLNKAKRITGENIQILLDWLTVLIKENLFTWDDRLRYLIILCNPALKGSYRYNPETFSIFLRGLQMLCQNETLPQQVPEMILLRGNITSQPYFANKLRAPARVYPEDMMPEAIVKQKNAELISACSLLTEFKKLYLAGTISKPYFLKELTGLGNDGLTSMEWAIRSNRIDVIATYFDILRELTGAKKYLSENELFDFVKGTAKDGFPLLVKVMLQGHRRCIRLFLQCLWRLYQGGSLNLAQFVTQLEARDKAGITALQHFLSKNNINAIQAFITYLNGSIFSSEQIISLLTIKKPAQTTAEFSLPAEAIKTYCDMVISQAPILKLSAEQVVSLTQTQWMSS